MNSRLYEGRTQLMSYPEPASRARLITGLRDLAEYLEANPDVPAPFNIDVMVFPHREHDAAMCAEIDRVAKILGAHPADERAESGHYTVTRSFGPVTYSAIAILADARARHDAQMSYHGSVIPDTHTTQGGR
jgi:hypothetical protein